MGGRRLPKGESDRYGSGVACGCDPSAGAIVLFYAYVPLVDPAAVISRLRLACERGGVTGKLRVAAEGINGTAAGPDAGVDALIRALETDPEPALAAAAKTLDYKREPGCAHLFPAGLSVRLVPEIVPFGRPVAVPDANPRGASDDVPSTSASSAARVEHLDPRAFHREIIAAAEHAAHPSSTSDAPPLVLDVRNYYESRVGRFDGADARAHPTLLAAPGVVRGAPGTVPRTPSAHVLHGRDSMRESRQMARGVRDVRASLRRAAARRRRRVRQRRRARDGGEDDDDDGGGGGDEKPATRDETPVLVSRRELCV